MYDYQTEKSKILTDEGQQTFVKIRDWVLLDALKTTGAIRMTEFINKLKNFVGAIDGWEAMAYIDRMVEIGDLRELIYGDCAAQHRVFIKAR